MLRLCHGWPRLLVLVVLLAACVPVKAGDELQVDLLGWRLFQFDNGVAAALGEPVHVRRQDGWTDRVYGVDGAAYLVVSVHVDRPHYIQALQVTGRDSALPLFAGLRLGDSRAAVARALGPPDRTARLDIAPIEPGTVEVHYYDRRNYSLEFDLQGRLYSVRILSVDAMVSADAEDLSDPWPALAAAVQARDFARLEPLLRPDVEVRRAGDVIAIHERYADFKFAPEAALLSAFFDGATGVAAAARQPPPRAQLRRIGGTGVGLVRRFPADSVLEELVFLPYLGAWRVYEVRFRGWLEPGVPVERG